MKLLLLPRIACYRMGKKRNLFSPLAFPGAAAASSRCPYSLESLHSYFVLGTTLTITLGRCPFIPWGATLKLTEFIR